MYNQNNVEGRRPRAEFEDPNEGKLALGTFIVLLIVGVIIFWYSGKLLVAGIEYAEAKRATVECNQWADEAKVYPGYYLAGWQKEQCDTYEIAVEAPVL